MLPWTPGVHTENGISVTSAAFAGLTVVVSKQRRLFSQWLGGLARRLCETKPKMQKSEVGKLRAGSGAKLQKKRGFGAFRALKNQAISTFYSWLAVFSFWSCAKNSFRNRWGVHTHFQHPRNDAPVNKQTTYASPFVAIGHILVLCMRCGLVVLAVLAIVHLCANFCTELVRS